VAAVKVLEKTMSLSTSLGLLGRKVGMMRLFTDDGDAVPVTVVDVSNNRVTQVKTQENDGYVALQVTFGARKASRVSKPQAGHLAKINQGFCVIYFCINQFCFAVVRVNHFLRRLES